MRFTLVISVLGIMAPLSVATATPIESGGPTRVFWSTAFGQTIESANLDGSNHDVLAHLGTLPGPVAYDFVNDWIYFTGVQGRTIGRVRPDGSSTQYLLSPSGNPNGIAVDPAGGRIYWAEQVATYRIMRADLDGGGAEELLTVPSGRPRSVALDVTGGLMYWTNVDDAMIFRSNLDGTGTVPVLATGISPIDIELDLAHGKIYWTENGIDGVIRRANLDGTGVQDLLTGLGNPLSLELDPANGKLYWSDHAYDQINRANLDGTNIETLISGYGIHSMVLNLPEPATALLLTLAAPVLLRRR